MKDHKGNEKMIAPHPTPNTLPPWGNKIRKHENNFFKREIIPNIYKATITKKEGVT